MTKLQSPAQMPRAIRGYVRVVDAVNYRVGRVAMYSLFLLIGILLYSSATKVISDPAIWTLEMAQFVMTAYFFLGGPYAMQMGSDVRMDLFYGNWSDHTRAWVDAFTALFLLFYLGVLLYGGVGSTMYAFEFGEKNSTAWRPFMWPIKTVMCEAIFLMILQATSELFKDIARIQDKEL